MYKVNPALLGRSRAPTTHKEQSSQKRKPGVSCAVFVLKCAQERTLETSRAALVEVCFATGRASGRVLGYMASFRQRLWADRQPTEASQYLPRCV